MNYSKDQIINWFNQHLDFIEDEGLIKYEDWLDKLELFQSATANELRALMFNSFKQKKQILNNEIPWEIFEDTVQTWIARTLVINKEIKEFGIEI